MNCLNPLLTDHVLSRWSGLLVILLLNRVEKRSALDGAGSQPGTFGLGIWMLTQFNPQMTGLQLTHAPWFQVALFPFISFWGWMASASCWFC